MLHYESVAATAEEHLMTNGAGSRGGAWVETTARAGTVRLCGELDMASRATVEVELMAHLVPSLTLLIDCESLTFCDSSGLATLIAVREKAATESATVRLDNLAPNVVRVLRATALMEAFGVEEPDTAS
jgi:anti-sigma B factor antagonist